MSRIPKYFDERLKEFVSKSPTNTGCLLWTSCLDKDGYGVSSGRANSAAGWRLRSHRIAWAFGTYGNKFGVIPPSHIIIRHNCDNPSCCNDEHLCAGTVKDNVKDALDRNIFPKGSRHGGAKLNEKLVLQIKTLYKTSNYSQHELASMFNISRSTIQFIVSNKYWTHVKE